MSGLLLATEADQNGVDVDSKNKLENSEQNLLSGSDQKFPKINEEE